VKEFLDVTVEGTALPQFAADAQDAAVGMDMPTVDAQTFAGDGVKLGHDGRPKVIMFLAHWCPHCQADVRSVQAWIDSGADTGTVDLYAVSTWADPAKPNYPPSQWLDREGWTTTTVVDDEAGTVASAFGLSGTPMYVFVESDGTVQTRYSGELPIDQLQQAIAELR
jgi:cytochrome c biogenesis protein CcmG, thiol:disulfide interchange protein DsbE